MDNNGVTKCTEESEVHLYDIGFDMAKEANPSVNMDAPWTVGLEVDNEQKDFSIFLAVDDILQDLLQNH